MKENKEKYPTTIYKYRDWSNNCNKKLLTNNELYTPSVSQINDPFDCLLEFDYNKMSEGFSAMAVDIMYEEFGNQLEKLGYNSQSLLELKKPDEILKIINLKKKIDRRFIESRKKHLGVISFSKRWNSILMWSHYSASHSGFCVGFDTKKLINSEYFQNKSKVSYKKKYPKIDPFDKNTSKIKKVFFHKAKDWSYEKEYRMTKLFGYYKDNSVEFEKQKLFYFDNNFITEVILGLKINPKDQQDIEKICSEKNIAVYKIESVPNKFKLTRKKL
jgi:hypothetical protein